MILFYILLIILCSLTIICALALLALNLFVNDYRVKSKDWKPKAQTKLLAVFAHPDDEVMVSGALARVKKHGGEVHLLYLTHGEDGPTGGIVEKHELGKHRETELAEVKNILQADSLEILDYPDRYLNTVDESLMKNDIKQRVEKYRPDTVLCFDSVIGLYGHTDHAFSGKCTEELLRTEPPGVKTLLVMTLPAPMIRLAMKMSKTFKERYDNSKSLPAANLAVRITRFAGKKHAVILAHKTQWQVMRDLQPLHDKIPYPLYYRIFSREYFTMIQLT